MSGCEARTVDPTGWDRGSRCSRTAVVDGKWCKQHSPEGVKARREKQDRRYAETSAIERENWNRLHRQIVAAEQLEEMGYRFCDIPACNCDRWHAPEKETQ